MQSTFSINRRHALAATAAGVLAGTSIRALADDDDRADWLDLWQAYLAEEKRHKAATDAYFEAEHAAEREHPEPAEYLWQCVDGKPRRYWYGGIQPASRDTINQFCEKQLHLAGKDESRAHIIAARDERLAALEAWKAECAAVNERFNVPALKAAREAQADRYEASERAIIDKPADSIIGVAVKLAVWARTELHGAVDDAGGEDTEEGQFWLAGPAVAAWHDACRIASLPESMGRLS